ncbi:MAG: hypothetical protein ABI995_09155, partial [Acidobacteriota bacterium]
MIFAAARQGDGQPDTSTNVYRVQLQSNGPGISRLTNFTNGENLFGGVTAVAYSGNGSRFAYTYTTGNDVEEVHLHDYGSGADSTLVSDKEGCVKPLCIECFTTCLRALHMTADSNIVLYSAARQQPFYTVSTLAGGTATRLNIFDGNLAASGQRVISQGGKFVFTAAAPNGPTFTTQGLVAQPVDVYLANLNGTNVQQVTHLGDLNLSAGDAVISSDGSLIAFALTTQSGSAAGTQIYGVRADGSGMQKLSDGSADATRPSISSDGNVVTYLQDGQVKVTGAGAVRFVPSALTKFTLSGVTQAVLSSDGARSVFFLGPRGGLPAGIYSAQANGPVVAFPQLTKVYTPRFLFPNGLVSTVGFAAPSLGSLMTAYGANLGNDELIVAQQFPLPTSMGGLELLADLFPMPIQAVTPWQINAHLSQSRLPATVAFQVRTSEGLSPNARVNVLASAPEAIIIPSSDPNLLAAAVYPGTKTLADAAHPAAANQVLEIYSLGFGATNPTVEAGVVSPSSPPAEAKTRPRLQIGGVDADVSFAGLVPGL